MAEILLRTLDLLLEMIGFVSLLVFMYIFLENVEEIGIIGGVAGFLFILSFSLLLLVFTFSGGFTKYYETTKEDEKRLK
jgi:uncharacterized Tic20 family protein